MFFRMKPRAKLSVATHFSLSRTRSNFSSITWAVSLLTTKLNTLCLPFCISESTRKCLHDCNSSLKLWSSTSPTMSSTSILLAPNTICVPCWVFLCGRQHKSREILRNTVYTCMFLKVLPHCVVLQYDNLKHSGTMLKSWDTGCNTRFQLNISFCVVHYCFLLFEYHNFHK